MKIIRYISIDENENFEDFQKNKKSKQKKNCSAYQIEKNFETRYA